MGIVLEFQRPEDPNWKADYVLHVKTAGTGFEVKLTDLGKGWPEDVTAFRKVAATLAPVAQGLISTAEDASPSPRGKLLGQVLMFEDGTCDMHMVAFENVEQRAWITAAFTRVLDHIKGTPLKT